MEKRVLRIGHLGKDPVVCFAVEELSRCLRAMDTALSLDIVLAQPHQADELIWVGIAPELCLPVDDPQIDDCIAVEVRGISGTIAGSNGRSVLIAVYRFLKALGCSWVRPGKEGEQIPQKKVEDMRVSIQESARFRYRGVCIEGANTYENVADMLDFLPKLGLNSYFIQFLTPVSFFKRWYGHKSNPYYEPEYIDREMVEKLTAKLEEEISHRGLVYHKTGHGWTCEPLGIDGTGWNSDKSRDYGLSEETRACLAMVDGRRELFGNDPLNTNLCYSNPKVRRRMVEAAVEYCKKQRNIDVLHFWLADGKNNQCECESCRKKQPSDWYVMLLNELDEALTEANLNTKIVFLIYMDLLWAPLETQINNQDRFILMFAPITRNYGESYGAHLAEKETPAPYCRNQLKVPASLGENLTYLRNWQEQFRGDGFVYDYHLMWAHLNDPGYENSAKNLFEDINCLHQMGLQGMISCQVQRCFFPTGLPMWVMARALWDEDADYEKMASEYYLAAYGEDGLLVQQYMQKISDLFLLYEGPSHGNGAKIDPPLCRDYQALRKCVEDFDLVISRHIAAPEPQAAQWQLLRYHGMYVRKLSKALELLEQNEYASAKTCVEELVDWLNHLEPILQKVLDGFNTKKHLLRRLDPQKCKQDMDV